MLMEWMSATCMTLTPLLASREMLSGDSVSMVMRACWSDGTPPVATESEPVVEEVVSLVALVAAPFLFRWVLMCLDK